MKWIACAALALAASRVPRTPPPAAPPSVITPTAESNALCADVGALRACWPTDGPADDVRLMPRPLPAASARSPLGWRCAGQGPTRTCVDRRAGAPPFVCEGARCLQAHPRRPDDGEWSCADSAGVTICQGGEPAAGVASAPADPAWICGALRAGAKALPIGNRVCVDLSPDYPDGAMGDWRCRTLYEPAPARLCTREPAAVLTVPCDPPHPCVDGSRCISGRCLPRRPAPDCVADRDCPQQRCRFGTCLERD